MKKNYKLSIYIIVFIVIALFFMYYLYVNESFLYVNESFDAIGDKIEIVISRYNEDLKFLEDSSFAKYEITIYNKGNNDDFYKPPNLKKTVKLENVGSCDYTYIYHIIENYENLSDITIFLPGSCYDSHKIERTKYILEETLKRKDTVLVLDGSCSSAFEFQLDDWMSTNEKNKIINTESELRKSDFRPYGKWFEDAFPNMNMSERNLTYLGIFSASKKDIHNRSKEFYQKYIQYINKSKNEECAHYVERSYHALFYPNK